MVKIIFGIALLSMIGFTLSTVCKDGSTCPGTTTCCLTPQGVGCCPYENANCCSDGLHCCPNGYSCNLSQGSCVANKKNSLTFLALGEDKPASLFAPTPAVNAFPDIKDLYRCLTDIKPVATDIYTAITEYKKGTPEGKDNAKKALIDLAQKGVVMGTDCYKVIQEILQKF